MDVEYGLLRRTTAVCEYRTTKYNDASFRYPIQLYKEFTPVAWKDDASRRRGIEGYAKEGHETGEIRVQAPQVAL
jgi:hypothetical protein